ncbi:putative ribonuclease H-like domain-containing protein [Rosa chinensis]|uniref:Putative ribonuclease H-like domain-containing protein n=1 Tax=Rosa chinensis TaxID=74649 RepID=A0A2P6S9Q1_ROSCH|nr:putative ribonuclease H-like domain-containing protein [Rosa chinensis]
MAEARAVLLGMNRALELNLKNVRIQSDSLALITDLNSKGKCKNWRTSQIIEEIRWRKNYFDKVYWEWIPREANCVAHEAALLGYRTMGLCRWAETPPPSLTLVLRNDGLPCPHFEAS